MSIIFEHVILDLYFLFEHLNYWQWIKPTDFQHADSVSMLPNMMTPMFVEQCDQGILE